MTKRKKIFCDRCSQEIESRRELIVTSSFFAIVPYHAECYGLEMKSYGHKMVGLPLNTDMSKFVSIVCLFFAFLSLIMPKTKLLAIPFLIVGLYRGYSWWKYERYLN